MRRGPSRHRTISAALALVLVTSLTAGCSLFQSDPDPAEAAHSLATGLAKADLSGLALAGSTPEKATQFVTKAYEDMGKLRPAVTVKSVANDEQGTGATATLQTTWDVPETDEDWSLRHRGEPEPRRRRLAGPVEPRARRSGSRGRRDPRPRQEVAAAGGHRRPVREQAHDRAGGGLRRHRQDQGLRRGSGTLGDAARRDRRHRRQGVRGAGRRGGAESLRRRHHAARLRSCAGRQHRPHRRDQGSAARARHAGARADPDLGRADPRPSRRGDGRADREVGRRPRGGRHGGPERPPAPLRRAAPGPGRDRGARGQARRRRLGHRQARALRPAVAGGRPAPADPGREGADRCRGGAREPDEAPDGARRRQGLDGRGARRSGRTRCRRCSAGAGRQGGTRLDVQDRQHAGARPHGRDGSDDAAVHGHAHGQWPRLRELQQVPVVAAR